jgi:hypothetical protein
MNANGPVFSRCSVGKNKWFWVTYRDFEAFCNSVVDASGYAKSAEEAEEQARASIHSKCGEVEVRQYSPHYASEHHRHQAIKRRAAKTTATKDTKEVEYLYRDYDYDDYCGSRRHRVVKKTKNRVYVAEYPVGSCNEDDKFEEDGHTFHDVKTVVLDRQHLELLGYASNTRCWCYFHTTPYEERHRPATFYSLEVLGLEGGADSEAITSAYLRLAKEFHPDHGGNAEDFKRLQEAYETAMSSVA